MSTPFAVAADVAAFVAPALVALDGVTVLASDGRLDQPIASAERSLRTACDNGAITTAVRSMYKRFGVDPTRTRPSSEALLRRLRKGDGLPRINTLVDVGNWCSVESQLPFGLYDLDGIRGPVELRLGKPGEEYHGIRKDVVHVGHRLTLADSEGPFGNPTADSARTMITTRTQRTLVVIYAPAGLGAEGRAALALTRERLATYAGGAVVWQFP